MQRIAKIMNLHFTSSPNLHTVTRSNQEQIRFIIDYFFKTMKGMKSLEYRIWARSFLKVNKSIETMEKYQKMMRDIRSIRHDKNFNRIMKDDK